MVPVLAPSPRGRVIVLEAVRDVWLDWHDRGSRVSLGWLRSARGGRGVPAKSPSRAYEGGLARSTFSSGIAHALSRGEPPFPGKPPLFVQSGSRPLSDHRLPFAPKRAPQAHNDP
jgi:hypothetical protein